MMIKLKTILLLAVFFSQLFSFSLWANTPLSPQIRQTITKHFTKSLPNLKIDSIETTPIANLYQVTSGPVVMLVTADGHYAISGDVLDLFDGKTNLGDGMRQKALARALDKFGESKMIVYAPPASVKPQYTVTVFTDVQCSYCQKFHAQIDKMNKLGIKVRYIAFPKTGKNTAPYNAAISTWCAPDRKAAFTKASLGHSIAPLQCNTHYVDKQFNLGAMAGVSGTPTIVIAGKVIPGYMDPEELLALAKELTPK